MIKSLLVITKIVLSLSLVCLLPLTHAMEEKEIESSFQHFNQQWMQFLYNLEKKEKENLICKKVKNYYITEYTGYSRTYSSTIKKTEYEKTPYIGVLKYMEKRFASRARTIEETINGPFHLIYEYPVTEIFIFSNGEWHY